MASLFLFEIFSFMRYLFSDDTLTGVMWFCFMCFFDCSVNLSLWPYAEINWRPFHSSKFLKRSQNANLSLLSPSPPFKVKGDIAYDLMILFFFLIFFIISLKSYTCPFWKLSLASSLFWFEGSWIFVILNWFDNLPSLFYL